MTGFLLSFWEKVELENLLYIGWGHSHHWGEGLEPWWCGEMVGGRRGESVVDAG